MHRTKIILTIVFAYISVVGLVTFALFIHEEAIQTTMFGTWPAKDINRWDIVLEGTALMGKINHSAKIINYSIGWIQPLAFFSYRAYSKSTDFYIKATEAEAFAHSPQYFIGKQVKFKFYPKNITRNQDGKWIATNNRLAIISDEQIKFNTIDVEGELIKYKQYFAVIK